jgi:hypothetical protein
MPWTPTDTLLGTVTEYQNFNFPIQYYTETAGTPDPITGLPGPTSSTYYPVTIVAGSAKDTVVITNGLSANISGFFKYVFNDTIQYKNKSKTMVTLVGDADKGTWDKLNTNDVYHMTSFKADPSRDLTLSYVATANGESKTYTIRINDPNWTNGQNALKNAIALTEV